MRGKLFSKLSLALIAAAALTALVLSVVAVVKLQPSRRGLS